MANDFSSDANCVALWKFEDGALTADSKGSNTLTAVNTPTADTGDYKEGVASVALVKSSSQYFSIADASLSTDFPCKNGGTVKNFSFCCWFKQATQVGDNVIFAKWNGGTDILIDLVGTNGITFATGNGDWTFAALGSAIITTGEWYHLGVTYEDSSGSAVIRLYRPSTGLAYTYTHSFTPNSIGSGASPVTIGATGSPGGYFDGKIDEVVVFKDILTVDEIDAIRGGTYSLGSTSVFSGTSAASTVTSEPVLGVLRKIFGTSQIVTTSSTPTLDTTGGETVTGETGTFDVNIPTLILDTEVLFGDAGKGDSVVPALTLSGQGATGEAGTAVIIFPALLVSGDDLGGGHLEGLFKAPTLDAVGKSGESGKLDLNIPKLVLLAVGVSEGDNAADIIFPAMQLETTGTPGEVGYGVIKVPLSTLDAVGVAGEVGTADLTIPSVILITTGGQNAQGVADLTFPIMILESEGLTDIGATLASGVVGVNAYTMNLQNFGVSMYTNYPFNSYCDFKGQHLGAAADGIYLLAGDKDVTTDIGAKMRKGAIGQKSSNKKSVPAIFVDMETEGSYDVIVGSENAQADYPETPYMPDLRLQKVTVGRGLKGRYFFMEMANRDGNKMRINSIEIPMEVSQERKGR